MDRMCMALGGRVAESLTFNKITTGITKEIKVMLRLFLVIAMHTT